MKMNIKLLSELDKNSRQPETILARKLRTTKQVIHYQLNHLEQQGIIQEYYALINTEMLGYTSYYIYIKLKETLPDEEKEIILKIQNEKYVGWLVHCTGTWDSILLIYARTVKEFEQRLTVTLHHCKEHLEDFTFTIAREVQHVHYPFLLRTPDTEITKTSEQKDFKSTRVDENILRTLSSRARNSILELSRITKIPAHVIRYRIRTLEKQGIIQGYKPKIDVQKMGYQWYLLLITMKNTTIQEKEKISASCNQQKDVYYITRVIGTYDLMLDVHVKNSEELKILIEDIKRRTRGAVQTIETQTIYKEHKISYYPE